MSEVTKQVAIELQVDGESAYAVESVPALVPIDTDDTGAVTDHTNKSITIYGRKGANARAAATITGYTLPVGFTYVSNNNGVLTFKAGSQATLATSANIEITATYDGLTFGMLIPIVPAKQGEAGVDGDDTEWIYKYDATGYAGTTGEVNPSGAASGNDTNKQQKGWVPNGWYDHALAISASNTIVYASYRTLNGATGQWGAFQTPIEWSHWGRNGQDGDGTEYVFIRTQNNVAPVMDSTQTGYSAAKFCPTITSASRTASGTEQAQTTDNPKGANETYPFEWCAKRTMTSPDSSGARTWDKYKGNIVNGTPDYKMSLWDKWAQDGGTPESRYQWNQSPTSAPSYSASSQDPGSDWKTNVPARPGDGYYLWMITAINTNGTYGTWGNAVRLTGDTGTAGEDGTDYEYIYILKTSEYIFPTNEKPANISTGEVSPGSHAASGSETDKTKDDWVPNGWWDNPQGVDSTNKIEYMSWRRKPKGSNTWSAFSDPIIWSSYGRNGMDGDGVEYVFVRTKDNVKPAVPTQSQSSTYCEENNNYNTDEHLPYVRVSSSYDISGSTSAVTSGGYKYVKCTDDPVGTDSTWKYEWVLKRSKGAPNSTTGVRAWEKYSGEMSLWANWGEDGGTPENRYQWNQSPTSAPSYSASSQDPGSDWKTNVPARPGDGYYLWMITAINTNGTYGTWGNAVRLTGDTGTAGEDGTDYEYIYILKTAEYTFPTNEKPANISTGEVSPGSHAASGSETDKTKDDWVPNGWWDNPQGVDSTNKIEYMSWRRKPKGSNTWSSFSDPIIWSSYGRNGMDGDGVEYVFVRTKDNVKPAVPTQSQSSTYCEENNNYDTDEHLPYVRVSSSYDISGSTSAVTSGGYKYVKCTDDPVGADSTWKYEWVLKRSKGDPNSTTGVRAWEKYSGEMSLWSNYAEDGTNAIRLDLDNQADIVAVDSDGKVRFARTVTVKARIYNGGTLQTSGISLPTSASSYISSLAIGGVTPVLYHTSINNSNKITGTTTSVTGGVLFIVWTFAQGTQMTANTTWPATIQLKYSNVTYDAAFSLTSSDTDAVYQLKPNKNELAFSVDANNAYTPSELRVKCGYTKDTGSGVTPYEWPSSPTAGKVDDKYWILYRRIDANGVPIPTFSGAQTEGWNWTYGTVSGERTGGEIIVPNTSTNSAVEFCLSPKGAETTTNSDIIDIESIPVVRSGKAGTSPFIADLDNEMDSVACDSSGEAVAQSRLYTKISAFYGSTDVTAQCTVQLTSNSTNGTVKLVSSNTDTGTGTTITSATSMSSSRYIRVEFSSGSPVSQHGDVVLSIVHSSYGTRSLTFTVNGVRAGDNGAPATIYNILPSLTEVSVGRNDDNSFAPRYNTLQCGYKKSIGSDITTVTEATGNIDSTYRLFFRRRNRSNQTWESTYYYYNDSTYKRYLVVTSGYSTSGLDVETYDAVEFYIYKNTSSNSLTSLISANIADKETVSVISDGENGAKGENSIRLALDNEHEDFIYSGSGKVAPSSVLPITATIYDGGTPIAGENVGWQIDTSKSSGTEIKNSGNPTTATYTGDCAYIGPLGDLKVNGLTADSAKIVVKAKYPNDSTGQYYYATFSANKTQQDKYDLVAKPNAIAFNDDETWTDKTIAISADRTDLQGNKTTGVTIQTTAVDGLRLYYKYVNANGTMTSEARMSSTSFTLNQTNARAYIGVYFELRLYSGSDYRLCDYETVEIAKVENGENGDDSYYVSTNPQVIYIETDSSGKVTDTTNHTIYVPFFKGNASSSTNGTISSATCSSDAINIVSTGSDYSRRINGISGKTLSSPVNVVFTATAYGVTRTTNLIVIPNKKGANGNDAIHIDLDNENDAIQYMGGSNLTGSVTSQARLYGATGTIRIDSSASTIGEDYCSIDGGLITVSDVMDSDDQNILSGIVVVKATVNNVDYYATFTVQRLDNGQPKYEIEIDSPVIIGNMDAASASVTVGVKVYRTAINTTTNLLERSLVSDLSTYNLKLWRRASTATNPTDYTTSYSSGWDMTINVKGISTSITDYTLYLTKDNVSAANAKTNYYDIEKIPVQRVYNGIQGEKGDVARQPYEWGTWENFIANNSNKFVANKYEAPYFLKDEQVTVDITGDNDNVKRIQQNKWLWVGEDGEYVPPGATPGPGQQNAPIPSSQSEKWELMVTDFKYLISEAQIADYGKFGAGIFSRDYAFSQYGRIDGASEDVNHYKNFRPEFFKGQPYVMFEGSKYMNTTDYPSSSPYEFGQLYLDAGVTYTFKFTFNNNIANRAVIQLIRIASNASYANWSTTVSATTLERSITISTAGDYAVRIYVTSSSFTATKIEVTANKAFRPNIYIDWLKGEIYSQLGRFVNVTVEGVINNLAQTITGGTSSNASSFGEVSNSGISGEGSGTWFFLNPTKVGSIVKYQAQYPLVLPCAFNKSGTTTIIGPSDLTLDELRQCIGKKIYWLTDGNTSMTKIYCGETASNSVNDIGMIVYGGQHTDLSDMQHYGTISSNSPYTRTARYISNTNVSNYFFMLECKMGQYNSHECIYWEVHFNTAKLT